MTEYQFRWFHPPETMPRWLLAPALKKKKKTAAHCAELSHSEMTALQIKPGVASQGRGGDCGGLASDGAGEMSHQKEYLNSRSGGMNVPARLG